MKPTPVLVFTALAIVVWVQFGISPAEVARLAVVAFVAFKGGQLHRGWMHARGIRKSHFNAVMGRGH